MKNDNKIRTLSIIAIILAGISLSIAYAAYSTTLNINGTATLKAGQWNVKFDNMTTPVSTVGKASSTVNSLTDTNFTFNVTLNAPGDSVVYNFDVHNTGAINAKLSSITLSGVEEARAKKVTYTIKHADGTDFTVGESLLSGASQPLKITVTYDSDAQDVPTTDVNLSLAATLVYVQA